ncbi:MAG TPA: substrate-binding domain-containing protein [Capillimicrobium sp.]
MFRRKGRLGVAVAVSALAVAAAGCGSATDDTSNAGSTSGGEAQEGPWKIAFQQPLGGQPWREMGLATLQNLANQPEYKDKVELEIVRTQNNDPAQQLAAMRNLVAEGVDMILFDPASPTGANPAIAQAKAAGIPVMAAGGPVDSEDAYVVSTDWDEAGAIGAQWLVDNMEGDKNVVVLEGFKGVPINENAMPIVRQTLEDGGANIIAQDANGWDEAQAQKTMAAILRSHDDIDGVYSFLTGGQGVPEAFKQAGRDFVPVVGGSGYNAEACTLAEYADQGLTGNMVSGQPAIYAKGLEQAVKVLEGEEIEREQFFAPLEVTTDDASKVCLPDRPPLFAIGYEFPGLSLPLDETLKYYKGS